MEAPQQDGKKIVPDVPEKTYAKFATDFRPMADIRLSRYMRK